MSQHLVIVALFGAAAVAILLGVAAMRPNRFRIQRTAAIKASPEALFGIISNFSHWPQWSPWARLDPAMKTTLSGAECGVGAISEWQGNQQVGSGRIEIIGADRPSRITMRLDMYKPFPASNTVEYSLEPQGDATAVTWAMHGPQPFLARLVGLFMNCDRMVGGAFEEGLANLKRLAEV